VIIGVPLVVVVIRTARVRLGATVAGCDVTAVLRTARVRDGVVVVVTGLTGVTVEAAVTVLPLLLIIVGSVAAAGIVKLPIERCIVVDGAVTAAAVVVVPTLLLFDRTTVAGFAAMVGDGTPTDDCVGVGVPITTCEGDADAADAVVTGAVAIAPVTMLPFTVWFPVPATVAAAVLPVVVPVAATVEAAVVAPPLTIVMPAPLSLITAGVASELMERLTVTSGFATSAGF
jgi:hypothetical protein